VADHKFSLIQRDNDQSEKASTREVETWHSHPNHKPTTPYELLHNSKYGDRRRPENAQIRRWMDLADQALSSDPEDDSTAA